MEVTNANWKEILLRQGVELDAEDKVVFKVNDKIYSYRVQSRFLQIISPKGLNDAIFKEIGLKTEAEVSDFCEKAYGYCPEHGFWPEYECDDYSAASAIVMAIYDEIESLEFDSLVSTAKDGSVSVQENPISTEGPVKDIDTIKITIKPIQTFKIIL